MKYYEHNGKMYTLSELSKLSGINYTTLAERLNRGYSIDEAITYTPKVANSVQSFVDASTPFDWDGLPNEELYKLYRNWCLRNDFQPESQVHFSRCLRRLVANLRIVPSRVKSYGTVMYKRLIRIDKEMENVK